MVLEELRKYVKIQVDRRSYVLGHMRMEGGFEKYEIRRCASIVRSPAFDITIRYSQIQFHHQIDTELAGFYTKTYQLVLEMDETQPSSITSYIESSRALFPDLVEVRRSSLESLATPQLFTTFFFIAFSLFHLSILRLEARELEGSGRYGGPNTLQEKKPYSFVLGAMQRRQPIASSLLGIVSISELRYFASAVLRE